MGAFRPTDCSTFTRRFYEIQTVASLLAVPDSFHLRFLHCFQTVSGVPLSLDRKVTMSEHDRVQIDDDSDELLLIEKVRLLEYLAWQKGERVVVILTTEAVRKVEVPK